MNSLRARVVPRSSRACLGGVVDGRLRVHVHAPPSDGAANREFVRLLARAFGVARSAVAIAAGKRSRDKTVHIAAPRNLPPELR